MKTLRKICNQLGAAELLAQLAEEAGELTQAALKLRRALTGQNPTPVPMSKALADLEEEIADVHNCISVVSYSLSLDENTILEIADLKRTRWANRLEGANE